MRVRERIAYDRATFVEYSQFRLNRALRACISLLGYLCWPVVLPLAILARTSDVIFVTCSQLLSLVPFALGIIVRYEFYRFALKSCGRNMFVDFGTVFLYRDISIGDNVHIGMYNTVHHCDFGSYVMTGEGCRLLSGHRYHLSDRLDLPMALQGGLLRRIRLEDDTWIGANAVIMNEVGTGSIVGASSVVRHAVPPRTVVAGNPARAIGERLDEEVRA